VTGEAFIFGLGCGVVIGAVAVLLAAYVFRGD
jgi:gas vesicle protein